MLELLGRPASVGLIRQLAAARYGDQIPGPRLASLRRDEQRSWRSAHVRYAVRAAGRPVYVVPALTYDRLVPVRGLLALSTGRWSAADRPASLRVTSCTSLIGWPRRQATWAPELERVLAARRGVPGATDGAPAHPGRWWRPRPNWPGWSRRTARNGRPRRSGPSVAPAGRSCCSALIRATIAEPGGSPNVGEPYQRLR